jgi:hypothetical protein
MYLTFQSYLEIQLDLLEKQTTFNELDMHISKAEISKAISKLRCGKSPGLDNISTFLKTYLVCYLG